MEVLCYSASNMVTWSNYVCNGIMFNFYPGLPHVQFCLFVPIEAEAEAKAKYVRTSLFSTARSEALLRPPAARDTGFQTGSDNGIKSA